MCRTYKLEAELEPPSQVQINIPRPPPTLLPLDQLLFLIGKKSRIKNDKRRIYEIYYVLNILFMDASNGTATAIGGDYHEVDIFMDPMTESNSAQICRILQHIARFCDEMNFYYDDSFLEDFIVKLRGAFACGRENM